MIASEDQRHPRNEGGDFPARPGPRLPHVAVDPETHRASDRLLGLAERAGGLYDATEMIGVRCGHK
jgi:hypothetical protein